jgi:hypothetical protein
MIPAIGTIVHFVLPWEERAVHRPAIVTASADPFGEIVNLNVFLDMYDIRNDFGGFHTNVCVQSVRMDESGTPGTWHWPEPAREMVERPVKQ